MILSTPQASISTDPKLNNLSLPPAIASKSVFLAYHPRQKSGNSPRELSLSVISCIICLDYFLTNFGFIFKIIFELSSQTPVCLLFKNPIKMIIAIIY